MDEGEEGERLWLPCREGLGDGAGGSAGTARGFSTRRGCVRWKGGKPRPFLLRRVISWGLYPPSLGPLRVRIFLRNWWAVCPAFPPLLLLAGAALWKATEMVQGVVLPQDSSLRSGLRPHVPSPSRAPPPAPWDVHLSLPGRLPVPWSFGDRPAWGPHAGWRTAWPPWKGLGRDRACHAQRPVGPGHVLLAKPWPFHPLCPKSPPLDICRLQPPVPGEGGGWPGLPVGHWVSGAQACPLSLPSFLVFLRYQCYYEYPLLTYLEYPILIAQGNRSLGPLHPLVFPPMSMSPPSVPPPTCPPPSPASLGTFVFQMSSSCCVSSISMGT